ncbi:MAG: flagellar biosynthesis protein FlhF [Marinobacter sp.]|uniref:flagellar biosynthesis protein FlhF n=1 Tax=Marinobacter sp. TaxID=50741 RepID=UPI00299D2E55|nr:flagellar biosynthesis protein FlhF [Marinobacter sp.]MDX1635966.1 flagellar biosynthesis protein FlhF [Marinobacter sp.]
MKVKRFFAPTMAEALKRVREQMGADAVILSNRKVDGGVEIVTALDYDENLARQRLGDAAVEATNGSRLAELQADQHRRLEEELGRSRDRIRDVRQKRADEGERYTARRPEPVPASSNTADVLPAQVLADMRAEISSLRDLVTQGHAPAAAVAPAATPADAIQQRLTERLEEFGLTRELASALARSHGKGRMDEGWKQSLKTLAAGIKTTRTEWLEQGGVYALVGPTGSGKTTTIGKMAARYVLRHGADSLALVTTDRYRVAAHEQLFVFGRILNVPVRVVDESHSLDSILDELSDRHLVLIDTAGLTQSDKGYGEQLRELADSRHGIRSHLVVPATSQPRIMKSMWHCYKMAKLAGCVMTKLDESLTLGEVLGFSVETGLAVAYYTDGQRIPQDLHHAEAIPLVRLGVERLKALQREQAVAEGA